MTIDPDVAFIADNFGFDVSWEENDNKIVYVCKGGNETRLDFDSCLVYQSVIWCGILNVLDLLDHLDENVGEYFIVGGNTDAVYYHTNNNFTSFNNGFFDDKNYKISTNEYRVKNCVEYPVSIYHYEKFNWKYGTGSYIHNEGGGRGKSWKAVFENRDKKMLCLAFENSSVATLRDLCVHHDVEKLSMHDYP